MTDQRELQDWVIADPVSISVITARFLEEMLLDAIDLELQIIFTTRRNHEHSINQPLASRWLELLAKLSWLVPALAHQVVIHSLPKQATTELVLSEDLVQVSVSLDVGLIEGEFSQLM